MTSIVLASEKKQNSGDRLLIEGEESATMHDFSCLDQNEDKAQSLKDQVFLCLWKTFLPAISSNFFSKWIVCMNVYAYVSLLCCYYCH